MYPCVLWWNPIIYFPWSGPVTQDISPSVEARVSAVENQMRLMRHVMVAKIALRHDDPPSLKQQVDALDSELNKLRTSETRTLLYLLRSLAPDEFEQVVKEVLATQEADGSVS